MKFTLTRKLITEPCGAVCSVPDFGTLRLLVRICICLCSECGAKTILAVQQLQIPSLQIVRRGHMLTHSTIYNAFGRCRWHVCAFLPTIPLGVSTVSPSTRQMPEWILRRWPCRYDSSSSLKRLIWNNITKKKKSFNVLIIKHNSSCLKNNINISLY
jgi:hypothetical protein